MSPTEEKPKRILVNNLNDLSASEWIKETISVYVQKGLGAKHKDTAIERQHPAPFSYQDVGRLINFFTKDGQVVLDPFLGVGSTLKACAINNRKGIGIELVEKYAKLSRERLRAEVSGILSNTKKQKVIYGDALKEIKKLRKDSVDFVVTSPPYWNILNKADHKVKTTRIAKKLDTKYSELKADLANIPDYDIFIETLSDFFIDCCRPLKPKKYICIILSDFRHKDRFYMFHADLAKKLEDDGKYKLKGIKVLYQRHKKIYPYGYPYSYVPNIHHQFILVLQNMKEENE